MIKVISNDFDIMTGYGENECVFQGRDFADNSGGKSALFSIYIAVLKGRDGYEINYSYKLLSWTEKANVMDDKEFLENSQNAIR